MEPRDSKRKRWNSTFQVGNPSQKPRKPLARRSIKRISVLAPPEGVEGEKPARTLPKGLKASRSKPRKAKKAKRDKLPSRKRTIKILDDLVSQIVRLRDGACVQCGTVEKLTCGHVLSRRSHATRWDLENCFAQCWSHNFAHGAHSPYPYFKWFIGQFGQEAFDALYAKWAKGQKFSTPELRAMIPDLQSQLEALQDTSLPLP